MIRPHARRRISPSFFVVLTFVAGFLLYLAVPNVMPVIRAAGADGTPGVFTAERLDCVHHGAHEQCTWLGEFRADNGERREVSLYGSDRGTLHADQRIRAFDVGRSSRVYGSGGSNEWVFTALLLVAGLSLFIYAARRLIVWSMHSDGSAVG
ncbi:hypothetical protein OHA77_05620 [Streptosporangium sp. NBC_01639]|uniref:hypothetical protein n=1 Tax=Streptosporangium sp. NBC_01639 TaxID=2975948 RepID=UPI00386F89CA|nr:hypothetical protein OHA77_05620 [Streptosporangium sp. NBC_01639]